MSLLKELWLGTLTRNVDDGGTDAGALNLVVNVDGDDVVNEDLPFINPDGPLAGGFGMDDASERWLGDGQGALTGRIQGETLLGFPLANPFDSDLLTNSSVRIGIRSDDAWSPRDILLFGAGQDDVKSPWVPLAYAANVERWLSTDASEGLLTMPLRRVAHGTATTTIRRVVWLTFTPRSEADTDDAITLRVSTANGIVHEQRIDDTPQDDFEQFMGNWYSASPEVPFTKAQIVDGGKITLSISGADAWRPQCVFVFGLDTEEGQPNAIVPLVGIPSWGFGNLSTDLDEGAPEATLPLIGGTF